MSRPRTGNGLRASSPAPPRRTRHVWRCRIVLLSAEDLGTSAICAASGTSKTTVWRWQARFLAEGVDGLLREKTRLPETLKTGNAENRG
ncbi:helix-turn-helix domain-containing protein [Paracoccus sp. (in: a-proteobacteria)]|uniref:helix-turn-helix domain-containing protein n=1 Tax=Paracoccus sp. TaxID=267 RepID=UPI003A8C7EA9